MPPGASCLSDVVLRIEAKQNIEGDKQVPKHIEWPWTDDAPHSVRGHHNLGPLNLPNSNVIMSPQVCDAKVA